MAIPYKTEVVSIKAGALTVSLEVVKNTDELFNELISRDAEDPEVKDERIPYWAELWPSSIVLANFLASHPDQVKDKKIIELGCGLGLSGIVAGMLGGNVLLTDYQQPALDFAAKNWSANISQTPCSSLLLDWRHPDLQEKYDIILAADVAYESKMFPFLARTLKKLLASSGSVLLTEPNRKFAADLLNQLRECGFSVESFASQIDFKGINHTIHFHRMYLLSK